MSPTPPLTTTPLLTTTPAINMSLECHVYGYAHNTTYIIASSYEGIPENLLINFIAWLVLLILFTVLRKIAWDYGRLALIDRSEENFRFSGNYSYNVWTSLFYGGEHEKNAYGSEESLDTSARTKDTGLFGWIPIYFRLRDTDIQHKCGTDAVQYLRFTRYLIGYVFIITVISIAIVLPVNITGSNSDGSDFGDTTISNIRPGSTLLWIHAILAVVYLVIAVVFMRYFSRSLQYGIDDADVTGTLMVSNIPKQSCFKSVITRHFEEAYPDCRIIDVQFAYNISSLINLDFHRQKCAEALHHSEVILRKSGHRPIVRPYTCGIMCCCDVCGCNQVDAISYYTEREEMYRMECEAEKATAFQDALGIAFVSFETISMAERITTDFCGTCKSAHNPQSSSVNLTCPTPPISEPLNQYPTHRITTDFRGTCKSAHNPQPSSVHRELNVTGWTVTYAPSPENIYWENLSFKRWKWWLRAIAINIALVILLFFFTTPTIIMSTLDEVDYRKKLQETHSVFLVQFLPTILLWTFSAILPNIVYYSDQFVGHWTKSSEHHSVMRKSFLFLILMVLILPSLGLTSAKALFEWAVVTGKHQYEYRWQCIFLAGNGAFFVNYVITSAFIGTALELLRFSQLFMYAIKLSCSSSVAEKSSVRKSVIWDFQFGIQYAWTLCVFAIIVCYSIPCPLVTPFGLVYLAFKYLVDRYNIYFSYAPSRINKHIHSSAVTFVIASVILLQFTVVFFTVLRTDKARLDPVFLFSALALFVSLLMFIGRIFFGWFRNYNPSLYQNFSGVESDESQDNMRPFVPSVLLQNKVIEEEGEEDEIYHHGYGATQDHPADDDDEFSLSERKSMD